MAEYVVPWSSLPSGPNELTGRKGHSAAVIGRRMYVFGGLDSSGRLLDELWAFDFTNNTWARERCSGASPGARQQHTATALDGRMYVFGGSAGDFLGDLWRFSPGECAWVAVAAANVPSARSDHVASSWTTATGMQVLAVVGGLSTSGRLSDFIVFDPATGSWSKQLALGASEHWGAAAVELDERLLIVGGFTTDASGAAVRT
eukprot:6074000-Prymnesium_polylepis.1